MAFGFLKRLAGDPSEAELRKIRPQLKRINQLSEAYARLSDAKLKAHTTQFRKRLADGESLDDLLPEAFATVREAAARTIKERHFDVQLLGGAMLHQGKIAEMKTGEGKTLTSTLPVYLNALAGQGVHVVTVNEYLARRDTEWMGQIYTFLGLSVGNIYHDQPREEKQAAYAADITYGTNNEFGFDYLRDNMVGSIDQVVQRPLRYAIVDEVDSILIDEARTPLIISGPAAAGSELYQRFAGLIPKLQRNTDYTVDEKRRTAILTDDGIKKMEQFLGISNIYEGGGVMLVHHLEQALQAHALYHRDKDYVVKDGEVVIVDEFTGRLMSGRRYSEGLHQAIEAKERVEIKEESRTMATITFQNYFRLYDKLAGMTGTAATEREEFQQIYRLEVVGIPTHRSMIRHDLNDQIYKTEQAKFSAIVSDVAKRHQAKQPVLLGTIAVEKSEQLSKALTKAGIKHEVLNAKNHAREAEIIARAGQPGAVTVSTNMAGRGTDIKLGSGVDKLGGLHVIGSERHEARRIDNQLRGRSGRQGDPGSSQFFVSLDDDLMRIFAGERIKSVMERLKVPEDQPIQAGMISRSIESAQKKVEGHNFDIRKHVVQYDDVMNAHREVIYRRRRQLLEQADMKSDILEMFRRQIDGLLTSYAPEDNVAAWQYDQLAEQFKTMVAVEGDLASDLKQAKNHDELGSGLLDMVERSYAVKEEQQGAPQMRMLERAVLLQTIDTLWIDHLDALEHLREGAGLRPSNEALTWYKQESYRLFEDLQATIEAEVTHTLFKVGLATPAQTEIEQAAQHARTAKSGDRGKGRAAVVGTAEPGEEPVEPLPKPRANKKTRRAAKTSQPAAPTATPPSVSMQQAEALAARPAAQTTTEGDTTITVRARGRSSNPVAAAEPKIGRNDPCPCGSGLKYKKCGLINAPEHQAALAK